MRTRLDNKGRMSDETRAEPTPEHPVERFLQQLDFTHADLIALTDVRSETIQNWVNRGLMAPTVGSPGRQGKRHYSGTQVAQITVASDLVSQGFQPSSALLIALIACLQCVSWAASRYSTGPLFGEELEDVIVISSRARDEPEVILRNELTDRMPKNGAFIVMNIGSVLIDLARREATLDRRTI
jgi:hypothetical protein